MKTFLGIDGGGTRTRALLLDDQGNKLHYAESGPSNLNAIDEATVRTSLEELINECIETTNTKPEATCLGLAGATAPAINEELKRILTKCGYEHFHLTSDAEIALEGALPHRSGILLIAGTGSVCLGKRSDGTIFRTGGWGWLVDDVGSAGWIGQRGLEIALKQHDDRLSGHAVRDALFKRLGIKCSEEIVAKIYRPLLARAELASLAETVLKLADAGDLDAIKIRDQAIEELAALVRTTSVTLGETINSVVVSGGLLENNHSFRNALRAELKEFNFVDPERSPVEAAALMASYRAQSQSRS